MNRNMLSRRVLSRWFGLCSILATLLCGGMGASLLSACGSDDEPVPMQIESGSDARPTWEYPDFNFYELVMCVEVQLQDTLQSYASQADLMCATIGGACRGVASPQQVNGQWLFPLIVASNEDGVSVSLSYYCDRLHRIFTTEWTTFDATVSPTGTTAIYKPEFVK